MTFFPVFPVFAVLVAAPAGPEDGCPSARQVTEAMQVRFPNYLVAPEPTGAQTRANVLRSVLDIAPDGTVVRFALVDSRGDTHLRRALPAPGRGRPLIECLAMADTVAAIVERYLGIITYESTETPPPAAPPPRPDSGPAVVARAPGPPPTPPPRAFLLAVGVAWRTTSGSQGQNGGLELRLGGQLDLMRWSPRLAVTASIGLSPGIAAEVPDGPTAPDERIASLRRFPVRLGALIQLPAGPGFVEPIFQTGADLLVLSATGGAGGSSTWATGLTPVLEAGVGYRLRIAGRFFLRPGIAIGLALKRYDTGVRQATSDIPLSTSWAYASFGIDTAMLFQ